MVSKYLVVVFLLILVILVLLENLLLSNSASFRVALEVSVSIVKIIQKQICLKSFCIILQWILIAFKNFVIASIDKSIPTVVTLIQSNA